MSAQAEPLNIVVLGASFAGCAAAHHFLSRVLPTLSITADAPEYRLVLVSPSTHIYWNIGAPRILVSEELIPYEDAFVAIEPGFERYGKQKFTFIQAAATHLDTEKQLITLSFPAKDKKESLTASRRATSVAGKRSSQGPRSPISQHHHQKSGSFGSSGRIAASQTIPYHALILATGSYTVSPLFTLQGPHEQTRAALDAIHRRIPSASNIVVAGGGPTGVETAGQLGIFYRPRRLASTASRLFRLDRKVLGKKRQITLISSTPGLLPSVDGALGRKAEKQLRGLGVKILHNTRIVSATINDGSDPNRPPKGSNVRTTLTLSDGTTLDDIDLYIPCTGVRPNTSYLPPHFLSPTGYANTDATPLTLRLVPRVPDPADPSSAPNNNGQDPQSPTTTASPPATAERVYAVGDCASYSANYVLDVYDAIPVLMHNLANDLLAWELARAQPYGGNEDAIAELESEDAVFQGRRAKPPPTPKQAKSSQKKREGPKKLRKRVARTTLMTPFLEAVGREGGAEKVREKVKGKAAVFAPGEELDRISQMSLSEAIKATDPKKGDAAADKVGARPDEVGGHADAVVDKSRWSGLAGNGKEKAKDANFDAAPRRGGMADTCEYDPDAPRAPEPAPASAVPDDFLKPPATAAGKGSANEQLSQDKPKTSGEEEEEEEQEQRVYVDTQICPITRFGGVGIVFGFRVPSLMVWALKGRDYRVGKGKAVVWNGNNPY
ncbi:MAG: hypothetical protein M1821_005764 [Bathelium mastoideum]|nr:MAG: hypothetical protein M1821_005764 [Bathelium mastoideum]